MKVAIIGGGAAGFFAALSAKNHHPKAEVTIFEKSKKLLSKVRVSGGGRCNVTNGSQSLKQVSKAYPRGKGFMKKALSQFSTKDTWEWFEARGIPLKVESDGRVFPQSDKSESIIDCLMKESRSLGIHIKLSTPIIKIKQNDNSGFLLSSKSNDFSVNKIIVATGGSPKSAGYDWIMELGHSIVQPIPSLFTFNMPSENITSLMGVVAPNCRVGIKGQKLTTEGPILITHWGMSGPAILKASAFGARLLSDLHYQFEVYINWINISNQEVVRNELLEIVKEYPQKQISSYKPFGLPERLWLFLIRKYDLSTIKKWEDLGKKGINKIISMLCNDSYAVSGKTTFKEEFVTCGGVDLDQINVNTMASKVCEGLYFAGEVMDIDGITGGYNFQAAWTTGYIAGKLK